MIEETHYKRMLNRIVQIFDDYRNKKCTASHIGSLASSNINALDNIPQNIREKFEIFGHIVGNVIEDYTGEEQYQQIMKLIEKYEPYIHELLRIDR